MRLGLQGQMPGPHVELGDHAECHLTSGSGPHLTQAPVRTYLPGACRLAGGVPGLGAVSQPPLPPYPPRGFHPLSWPPLPQPPASSPQVHTWAVVSHLQSQLPSLSCQSPHRSGRLVPLLNLLLSHPFLYDPMSCVHDALWVQPRPLPLTSLTRLGSKTLGCPAPGCCWFRAHLTTPPPWSLLLALAVHSSDVSPGCSVGVSVYFKHTRTWSLSAPSCLWD